MEEKLGQSTAVLFKYEKLILAEEETTSAGGCGVSLAAFSRPASACPSGRVSQGVLHRILILISFGVSNENDEKEYLLFYHNLSYWRTHLL